MTQYLLNQRVFSKPTSTSTYSTSTATCIGIYSSLHEAQETQENIIFDFLAKKYGEDAFSQKCVKLAEQKEDYPTDAASPTHTWILPINTIVGDHSPSSAHWARFPTNNHFIVRKSSTPLKLTLKFKRATNAWVGCSYDVQDVMELEIVELEVTKIPKIEYRSRIFWYEYPSYCDALREMSSSKQIDFLRVAECDNTIESLKDHFAQIEETPEST